jgi:hypothetical protein
MTVLAAIAVGIAIGLLTGGRLREVGRSRVRSVWLLLVGVGMQFASPPALLLVSYAFLGAFAVRNVSRTGMGVILLGLALNAAPIVLDGGMPVEGHAIISAGIASGNEIADLTFGSKRHLAHNGDHLRAFDDTIPEWFTHEVLSFGDLVIAVGVAAVFAGLLHPSYTPAVSHRS